MIHLFLLLTMAGARPIPAFQDPPEILATEHLGAAFASWRLNVLTREDGPAALEALQALIAQTEISLRRSHMDRELSDLLAQMWMAELDEWEHLRDSAGFEARAMRLLGLALWTGDEVETAALSRAARRSLDPARVQRALTSRNRTIPGTGPQVDPSKELIAAAIQDAVQAGDHEFVRQVGALAVPTLIALAQGEPHTESAGPQLSPLALLGELAPSIALDVALEHVATGDILRKTQVVRAFGYQSPFASDRVWTKGPKGALSLVQPEWSQLVVGLLESPSVPKKWVDPHLVEFIARDVGPDGFEGALEDWLLRHWPNKTPVPSVMLRAARGLIQRPELDAQLRGAKLLVLAPDATVLYERIETSDPELRQTLTALFRARSVWVSQPGGQGFFTEFLPKFDSNFRAALDRFIKGHVDLAAADTLTFTADLQTDGHPAVIDAAGWQAWLQAFPADQATWIRPLLRHLGPLPANQRQPLLQEVAAWIASSPDHPASPARVDALIRAASEFGGLKELVLAAQACTLEGFSDAAMNDVLQYAPALLESQPQQASLLIAWLENQPSSRWDDLVEQERSRNGSVTYQSFLKALPVADQMRIARNLWRQDYDRFAWLDEDDFSLGRQDWLELIADVSLPARGRIWAMNELCSTPGKPLQLGGASVFADAIALAGESPRSYSDYRDAGVDPKEILRHLLAKQEVDEQVLLDYYVPLEGDGELADQIRERFPPKVWNQEANSPLLASLVQHLVHRNDPIWNEDLKVAASAGGNLQRTLIESMIYLRSKVHLPVAGDLLRRGVFNETAQRLQTVNYVANCPGNDSMEHILAAARNTGSESYRAELFNAAQRVLAWREIEDRWRAIPLPNSGEKR